MTKLSSKAGLPPGTLVHIGEKRTEPVKIQVIRYDAESFEETEYPAAEVSRVPSASSGMTWVNVSGIHDIGVIEHLGGAFALHPLTLEDIVNTEQRPKLEEIEDYIFIVLKMLCYDEAELTTRFEQVSIVVRENHVLLFQEQEGDVFDQVRNRIRTGKGRIRKEGSDYLAYALMDAVVDGYFVVLESFGEMVEDLQDELVENPSSDTLEKIHLLKRELIFIRKSVWPMREVLSTLERGDSDLIRQSTIIYLRDVHDHAFQLMDTIETYRDMTSGMIDIYLSSISNRMNEVMKVLTIIATIFIPLTFVAGVYGMNFQYMPELGWEFGYPTVIIVMSLIVIVMIWYFRKKKWL